MSKTGSMRDKMPKCAAFVDAMRAEFGASIGTKDANGVWRMANGEPWYAIEGEHVIGNPPDDALVRTGRMVGAKVKVQRPCAACGAESDMRRGERWLCRKHY